MPLQGGAQPARARVPELDRPVKPAGGAQPAVRGERQRLDEPAMPAQLAQAPPLAPQVIPLEAAQVVLARPGPELVEPLPQQARLPLLPQLAGQPDVGRVGLLPRPPLPLL